MPFAEGVRLLNEAGIEQDPYEDLSTPNEKALGTNRNKLFLLLLLAGFCLCANRLAVFCLSGAIIKEKYNTDFYRLDKFPTAARPFYTMLDPTDEKITNSYVIKCCGNGVLLLGCRY